MPGPPRVPPARCPAPLDGGGGAPVPAGLPNLPPHLGANLSRAGIALCWFNQYSLIHSIWQGRKWQRADVPRSQSKISCFKNFEVDGLIYGRLVYLK